MSKTITMILAAKVVLHDNQSIQHSFGPGICEVPVEFADHWFMKAHGAVKYNPAAKAAELLAEAAALEEAAKIEAAKVEAATLEEANKPAVVAPVAEDNESVVEPEAAPEVVAEAAPVVSAPWAKK